MFNDLGCRLSFPQDRPHLPLCNLALALLAKTQGSEADPSEPLLQGSSPNFLLQNLWPAASKVPSYPSASLATAHGDIGPLPEWAREHLLGT